MSLHDHDHNEFHVHAITGPEVRKKVTERFLNLSALAVREKSVTLFLLLAVLGAGVFSFFKLGRAEDPTFTVKVFTVATVWPGATAQEMQDLVAEPLEKRMQELRDYDRVETFTRPGLALLKVSLKDSMNPKDVPEEFYQARKKLGDEAHKLPQGAYGPFINDEYSDVTFALYSVEAHGLPLRALTREAEVLRQRFLHVPGVKKIDIVGERPERIFVEFSYPRLATLGVSPQQIFDALTRENAVTPSGSIDTQDQQVFIRLDGALNDLQKIRDTPIVAGGRTLALSDVADVKRGYEDPATFMIRHNGEDALLLSIVMREGWNGLDLGKALESERKQASLDLPAGIVLSKVTDQAVNITEAYDEFMLKFCVALAVVMIVSLISLGWRVGIVVAAAVPLTLAITFVIMLATGRAFDRITLGALILGLGLLVDDAIISIEIMVVKMQEGWNRIQAAGYAWSHTATPMLSGTLVTVVALMPVGFAKSTAGEYAGNIFWVVAFALLTSWVVAVTFTPYLGVKLLPNLEPIPGGHAAIYATPGYQKIRSMVQWAVDRKFIVAGAVVAIFFLAVFGMGFVRQQFFPSSDRPEMLVEVTLPQGSSIETTSRATAKVEDWLRKQPEAKIVTAYIGAGAPRFFLAYNPELPNPNFAKIIVLTPSEKQRDALKLRLGREIADGLAPEARIRATQLVFGPYTAWPVELRVMGPDVEKVRAIAEQVRQIMVANPNTRLTNADWGEKAPTVHFVLDQDRLHLIGLSPSEAGLQIQFLLTGVPVTQVREDIRTVDLMARSAGADRLDPSRLQDMTLISHDGKLVPVSQIGHVDVRVEEPILKRRDRIPTITLQCDIAEGLQPPQVSAELMKALAPVIAKLPAGYRIETGGNVEESNKANVALGAVFPIMIILMFTVIMIQVRSFSAMFMVVLTAPLGLAGTVPTLLLFHQPFGFNAILGLIALAGIIMRNTLILIGQIKTNQEEGLDVYGSVVEATVQRARPVLLTALAAVLAFIPLTFSVFWGSMAYTLIGGTLIGTVLTLVFLPALYAIWYRVQRPTDVSGKKSPEESREHASQLAHGSHDLTHPATAGRLALGVGLVISIIFGLTGCRVGPNYRVPNVQLQPFHNAPSVEARTDAPAAPPLDQWWTGFQDPKLTEVIQRALQQNLDLAASMARVQQARAAAKEAGANRLPAGNLYASTTSLSQSTESPAGRLSPIIPKYHRDQNYYDLGISASWETDLFGSLRRGSEAATAEAQAAEAARTGVRISIAAEAADAYLQIRGAQARLGFAHDQIATDQHLVDLVRQRRDAGVASDREHAQAEALLSGAKANVPLLETVLESQLNRLDVLMGVQPGTYAAELKVVVDIPAVPAIPNASAPVDLLRRRPDIIAAEREVAASNARIGQALAEYYPKLSLSGIVGSEALAPTHLFEQQGFQPIGVAGLRWRLFDFGRVDAEVKQARGANAEALVRYRSSVLHAAEDVEDAFSLLVESERRRTELLEEIAQLQRVRDRSQESYQAGVIGLTDVLDADRQLLAAKDELAVSRVSAARAAVGSFRALGGGWQP